MAVDSGEIERRIAELEPIGLDELDATSALRERVDTKYVIPRGRLEEALAQSRDAHRILEIDGDRVFDYESVYFDTADLRCFYDHVEGVRPRFKTRTRFYRETGACFLEVKVKDAQEVMTKRQREYDVTDHGQLVDAGVQFVDGTLRELTGESAPSDLAPSLSTGYRRFTLAPRERPDRITVDLDVRLRAMDDRRVRLRDQVALVETKTAGERGPFDGLLLEQGCTPVSISKYRLGIGMLLAQDPQEAHLEPLRSCFA